MVDTAQLGPAFEALTQLAQLSRAGAHGLPAQVDIRPHWSGIGFSLLGRNFVAPLGEVSEMLKCRHSRTCPVFSPGFKAWPMCAAGCCPSSIWPCFTVSG